MEAELLESLAETRASLSSIAEALQASPEDPELLELQQQLQAALVEAEAALAGLQVEACDTQAAPVEQQHTGGAGAAGSAFGNAADAATGPRATAHAAAQQVQHPPAAAAAALTQPRAAAVASANARIHPRSRYALEAPDFAALAAAHPSLRPYLLPPRGGGGGAATAGGGDGDADAPPAAAAGLLARASLDFTSPAACRELTRVLLRADFGLEWWVPLGQLVPPLTNRANYIHWVEDLLSLSAPSGPAAGLDVGCGANLIYCLLGAALCGWRMVGADITPTALEWAARNLGANPQLQGLVELRAVGMQPGQAAVLDGGGGGGGGGQPAAPGSTAAEAAAAQEAAADAAENAPAVAAAPPAPVVRLGGGAAAGGGVVSGALRRGERLAFCMCNPPFFESLEEAGRNPATAFGGTAAEMVYPGGELAFVTAMIQDSLTLRGAVHWYTTMAGKKGTLRAARSLLYRHGVRVLRTTELSQGKTVRWALAWSFTADASAASQPLPRFPGSQQAAAADGAGQQRAGGGAARPAAAAARPVGRKASWQVQAPARAGGEVLAALQQALRQAGVRCSQGDAGPYSLRATHRPTADQLAASAAEASAAEAGPAAKRQRSDGGGQGEAPLPAQQPGQQAQQQWQVDLQLFQQHPGLFLLTVSLHRSAPDGPCLPWFASLARQLQAALAERWTVAL